MCGGDWFLCEPHPSASRISRSDRLICSISDGLKNCPDSLLAKRVQHTAGTEVAVQPTPSPMFESRMVTPRQSIGFQAFVSIHKHVRPRCRGWKSCVSVLTFLFCSRGDGFCCIWYLDKGEDGSAEDNQRHNNERREQSLVRRGGDSHDPKCQ